MVTFWAWIARATSDAVMPAARNVTEIQALLDAETMLLEFRLGDERSYLWSVS